MLAQQGAHPRIVLGGQEVGRPRGPEQQVGRAQDDDRPQQPDDEAHPERGVDPVRPGKTTELADHGVVHVVAGPTEVAGAAELQGQQGAETPDRGAAAEEGQEGEAEVARHPAGAELLLDAEHEHDDRGHGHQPDDQLHGLADGGPAADQEHQPAQLRQDQPPDEQQPPGRPQPASQPDGHHQQQGGVDETGHQGKRQQGHEVPLAGEVAALLKVIIGAVTGFSIDFIWRRIKAKRPDFDIRRHREHHH